MEIIFTIKNPCNIIRSVEIFKPLRGNGGTRAYHVRIDDYEAVFEINDDANWEINSTDHSFQVSLLGYINQLILNIENQSGAVNFQNA
jgi:hypothetical protein